MSKFNIWLVVKLFLVFSFNIFLFANAFRIQSTFVKKSHITMQLDSFLYNKLFEIQKSYKAIEERLSDPDVINNLDLTKSLSKDRSSIEPTVTLFEEWVKLDIERADLVKLENENHNDSEMKELVRSELKEISSKLEDIELSLLKLMIPQDPNDKKDVMLEIRAGTGGDEAGIFAGDLLIIYRKYCESLGWKFSIISEALADMGGYKTCIIQITGDYVYSKLKYEVIIYISTI